MLIPLLVAGMRSLASYAGEGALNPVENPFILIVLPAYEVFLTKCLYSIARKQRNGVRVVLCMVTGGVLTSTQYSTRTK